MSVGRNVWDSSRPTHIHESGTMNPVDNQSYPPFTNAAALSASVSSISGEREPGVIPAYQRSSYLLTARVFLPSVARATGAGRISNNCDRPLFSFNRTATRLATIPMG